MATVESVPPRANMDLGWDVHVEGHIWTLRRKDPCLESLLQMHIFFVLWQNQNEHLEEPMVSHNATFV